MLETVTFDLNDDLVASTASLKLLLICEPENLLDLELEFSRLMIRDPLVPHSLKLNSISDSSCRRKPNPIEEDDVVVVTPAAILYYYCYTGFQKKKKNPQIKIAASN